MSNKMLIDATHPEETRVVVLRGNRVEEFDFESADRQQLRGNIYLAKVTRVEPSLQAAFVEYGGNRHGFLAFSEIHPDYYQIPFADRQALLREQAEEDEKEEREDDAKIAASARASSEVSAEAEMTGGEPAEPASEGEPAPEDEAELAGETVAAAQSEEAAPEPSASEPALAAVARSDERSAPEGPAADIAIETAADAEIAPAPARAGNGPSDV